MGTQLSLTKPTARFPPHIFNMATTFASSIAGLRVAAKTAPAQRRQLAVRAAAEKSEAGGSLDTTGSTSKAFCFGLPGNTAPMGDFDPAGFTKDADQNTVKRYREAELTHGRVSMLGITGFIVGENFNPLFDGEIKGPAINQFQQLPNSAVPLRVGSAPRLEKVSSSSTRIIFPGTSGSIPSVSVPTITSLAASRGMPPRSS